MWNYSYVTPSLLILVVFLGYYFMLPRIPIKLNRTYVKLVCVEVLVMLLDIISTWACMNYENLPIWLLYSLNAAYFVVFYLRGYMFFLFTLTVLRVMDLSLGKRILIQLPALIASILAISSPLTKLIFYFDENGYNSGVLYNILYVVFAIYLILSFAVAIANKSKMRRRREFNSCIWYNIIIFLGITVRYILPTYLLMDTLCLVALIVIYLSYENPDFYLEERSRVFNAKAFREYAEELCRKKNFRILEIVVHNYRDNRELYGIKQMDQGIHLMGDYMRRAFKKYKVFYYRSGRFIILGDEDMDYVKCLDEVKRRFKKPWKADEAELFLDFGAAFIEYSKGEMPFENLMSLVVDAFVMASELEGGEVVEIGSAVLDKSLKQSEIKKALKDAVENEKVLVYLQPIIDSKSGKVVGAEALARIKDKNGDIIPPELFIPIAEKNGMINQLGEQVFRKTCQFIGNNNAAQLGLSWINVNLSPIQFMRQDIAERLNAYMTQYDINPELIHLEITEEIMIDEMLLERQMEAFREKGFKFVLDDYGKGYSNMTRLKKCPFINIKLDMSIVWDYCNSPDEMVPNMVETFEKIGFDITAEGIEDEDMMNKMAEIGVNYLQGYLFSKPVPMEEFAGSIQSFTRNIS